MAAGVGDGGPRNSWNEVTCVLDQSGTHSEGGVAYWGEKVPYGGDGRVEGEEYRQKGNEGSRAALPVSRDVDG